MNTRPLPHKLGVMLRTERLSRGESLAKVAKGVRMHFQHLSKVERGDRLATPAQAAALGKYFGLDAHRVEARRLADEFWWGKTPDPAALAAVGLLQEDAGVYDGFNASL